MDEERTAALQKEAYLRRQTQALYARARAKSRYESIIAITGPINTNEARINNIEAARTALGSPRRWRLNIRRSLTRTGFATKPRLTSHGSWYATIGPSSFWSFLLMCMLQPRAFAEYIQLIFLISSDLCPAAAYNKMPKHDCRSTRTRFLRNRSSGLTSDPIPTSRPQIHFQNLGPGRGLPSYELRLP